MKSMGAVAVLHPQDSLNNHPDHNLLSTPNRSHRTVKFNHSYTNSPRTANFTNNSRKRSPQPKGILKNNNKSIGQVSILKRGESLSQVPDPETFRNQKKKNNTKEFFAGSAFVDSPPPSSVPIPGFFTKSFVSRDDPTTELRRILGLSL